MTLVVVPPVISILISVVISMQPPISIPVVGAVAAAVAVAIAVAIAVVTLAVLAIVTMVSPPIAPVIILSAVAVTFAALPVPATVPVSVAVLAFLVAVVVFSVALSVALAFVDSATLLLPITPVVLLIVKAMWRRRRRWCGRWWWRRSSARRLLATVLGLKLQTLVHEILHHAIGKAISSRVVAGGGGRRRQRPVGHGGGRRRLFTLSVHLRERPAADALAGGQQEARAGAAHWGHLARIPQKVSCSECGVWTPPPSPSTALAVSGRNAPFRSLACSWGEVGEGGRWDFVGRCEIESDAKSTLTHGAPRAR